MDYAGIKSCLLIEVLRKVGHVVYSVMATTSSRVERLAVAAAHRSSLLL